MEEAHGKRAVEQLREATFCSALKREALASDRRFVRECGARARSSNHPGGQVQGFEDAGTENTLVNAVLPGGSLGRVRERSREGVVEGSHNEVVPHCGRTEEGVERRVRGT